MIGTTKRSFGGRMAGLAVAATATLGMGIASAAANVLVSDNFDSAANNSSLAGRSPDTGSHAWHVNGTLTITKSVGDGEVYTTDNDGNGGNEGDIQLDAGSFDHYVVSATLNVQDTAYVGLGFLNDTSFFTKSQVTITLRPNGRLDLYGPYNDADRKSTSIGNVTIAGFDGGADHTVKVIYNAAANKASVVVDGDTVIAPVAVTDHNGDPYTPILKYGAFRFQNPTAVAPSYPRARADDFQITATPEPGSLALLGLGGLVMLRRRKSQ